MKPTFGQTEEFYRQIAAGRVTEELFRMFLENPERYRKDLGRFGRLYDLSVNYDLGVDRLVADNKFAWKNNDVKSANFPLERRGVREVTVELYEFDRTITGTEATAEIEGAGYINEDVAVLLTFGKENQIVQRRRPVVALGSRWRDSVGGEYVPDLCGGGDGRGLHLYDIKHEFGPACQFLVSRKQK